MDAKRCRRIAARLRVALERTASREDAETCKIRMNIRRRELQLLYELAVFYAEDLETRKRKWQKKPPRFVAKTERTT